MKEKLRIGVLASTRGTNLQALIEDIGLDDSEYEIVCVVSNVYNAGALEKAREAKIPAVYVDQQGKSREAFDQKMVDILKKMEVELVCLVGFMKILTPVFVESFRDRVVNVHPSLIPAFSGPGYFGDIVHESVLYEGCKISGMTIHLVDEEVDNGKILCQKTCEVEDDNIASLKQKVQSLEKEWYPKIVRQYAKDRMF